MLVISVDLIADTVKELILESVNDEYMDHGGGQVNIHQSDPNIADLFVIFARHYEIICVNMPLKGPMQCKCMLTCVDLEFPHHHLCGQ